MARGAKSASKRAIKPGNPSAAPPPPFELAGAKYATFLSTLDPSKIYITHVDTLPAAHKRSVFLVPLFLNIAIFALLCWRAYIIIPTYFSIILAILGNKTPEAIDTTSKTYSQLAWIIGKRAFVFLLDYLLVALVAPWPLTFFLETPANPTLWRWRLGFRDNEVCVRESRSWGARDLLSASKQGEDNPFFKVRILPAISNALLREKTGYLLMGKDYDLDFAAMLTAHSLIDDKATATKKEGGSPDALTLDDFRKSVWVHCGDETGWAVWPCWKLDATGPDEESERRKIMAFHDRLAGMGKESLFFRWVELIQYESTQPGGFTREHQLATVEKGRKLFEEQGVDFEVLMHEIGGFEGMPGFERQRG